MKTKQEQIEEMAKVIQKIYITKISRNEYCLAQDIYEAGYRKANDVIDEFVRKIKNIATPEMFSCSFAEYDFNQALDKLAAEMRKEERKDEK